MLQKLLDWPFKSFEKSLNQAVLPHAIIALNTAEISTDGNQWDENMTQTFLKDFDKVLKSSSEFEKYMEFWTSRGKDIQSLEDLLKCYYTSVTVIRIPRKPAYMRIGDQVERLHKIIGDRCKSARGTREKAQMLSDANELHTYLQYAFDHFSVDLDKPFNFIEVSLNSNPIPPTFAGNILKLAIEMKNRCKLTNGTKIFSDSLGKMVVSCILLDITRRSKGQYLDYLPIWHEPANPSI
jgi:hypothetical protein